MGTPSQAGFRRLIVTADDFGQSKEINQAVAQAHEEGILTAASLMVAGSACAEAVELARRFPRLGVGLHLTLSCGRSLLPHSAIPGLVDHSGQFAESPSAAGWRYFFDRGLREQLRQEVGAQFRAFHETGLKLDHVNGHQHLHLHPVIFEMLMKEFEKFKITHLRLTADSFRHNARLASGRWIYRALHSMIYGALSSRAHSALSQRRIKHTDRVFGALQTGDVHEQFVIRLLETIPPGDSELYSHPSVHQFSRELDALLSPRVREIARRRNIQLIRYQDLA